MRETEQRLEHLNRVLLAIRSVNQLIVTETDPQRLIEGACAKLTETLGYHNAWIALLDEEGETMTSTAASGFDGGFEVLHQQLEGGQFPACMKRALGQGALEVVQDPVADCLDCPLSRQYASRAGLTSRLTYEGRPYGILSVSVPAAYAGDVEEQDLLKEVSGDLAFGLRKIEDARALRLASNIVDSSPAVAFVWENAEGWPVRYVSRNVEHLFEFTVQDFVSGALPYTNVVHPDDLERVARQVASSSADRTSVTVAHTPYRIVTQSGDVKWVEDMTTIQRAEDGHAEAYRGILLDITARVQSEEALRGSVKLLREIAENYPNSYISIIEEGYTVGFTAGQEFRRRNLDPEQFIGMSLDQMFGDQAAIVRQHYEKTFKGEEQSFELFLNDQHQLYRTVPLHSDDGSIHRILAVAENITERKRAEEVRETLETQLRQAQKMEAIGRLAGGVAHDMNNMLVPILGYGEMLQGALSAQDATRELVDGIVSAALKQGFGAPVAGLWPQADPAVPDG